MKKRTNGILAGLVMALALVALPACGGSVDMYDVETKGEGLRSCDDMEASYSRNCGRFLGGEASCSQGAAYPDNSVPITCTCDGGYQQTSSCGVIA